MLTFLGIEQRVKSFNVGRGRGLPKKIKRRDRGGRASKGPGVFSGMDDFQEVQRVYTRGEGPLCLSTHLAIREALRF